VLDVGAEVFAIDDPDSPFRIAFLPVSIAGEPVCHEHTALVWGSIAELAQLPLAPSDCKFVSSRAAGMSADTADRSELSAE
jgi:hypothetical protein